MRINRYGGSSNTSAFLFQYFFPISLRIATFRFRQKNDF
jgi:hypothetical protein